MSTPPPHDAAPPLLEARGLERRIGGRVIWKGLDLQVGAGELILLAGPNGAGKTTLLRCLAGLARPRRGTVRICGIDPYQKPAARAAIGCLFHDSLLYDDLTARENLRFAAALHGFDAPAERIRGALETAGLALSADQRVGNFSRGMVQRLALVRATLHRPLVLLLDEPFTGLDPDGAATLRRLLAAERERGCAILCVTHEPAEIWELATRVLLIHDRVIRSDRARPATLDEFRTSYAAQLA